MADQVTSATGKTPDEIEQEMFCTRESLTEKVAALENQVVEKAHSISESVSETVEAVKSFVSNAPGAVSETVKQAADAVKERVMETFDVHGYVQRHPWVTLGASTAMGCVAGYFLLGRGSSRADSPMVDTSPIPVPPERATPTPAPVQPGVWDDLMGMISNEAKQLAHTALESIAGTVKENIHAHLPHLMEQVSARFMETAPAEPTSRK